MTSSSEQETQHLLRIDEEINILLTMYARRARNRETPTRSKTNLISETEVTCTIPEPMRFARRKKAVGGNQTANSLPQLLHVDEKDQDVKFDSPYEKNSALFQHMESVPFEINVVKTYTSTRDMHISTASTTKDK